MNSDNNEIFTEEQKNAINGELKKNENAPLPDSLSADSIRQKLASMPQNEAPKAEVPKKKRDKRLALRIGSGVAAAVVLATSLVIYKPWLRVPKPPKVPEKIDDYSQIEILFAGYSASYKAYINRRNNTGIGEVFGGVLYGAQKSSDTAAAESFNSAAPGVAVNEGAVEMLTTDEAATEKAGYGKTNEQVAGVSEADIIKNDGKYLYIVENTEPNWSVFYDRIYGYGETPVYNEAVDDVQVAPGYNPDDTYGTLFTTEAPTESTTSADTTAAATEPEQSDFEIPELDYDCKIDIVEPKNGKMSRAGEITVAKPENKMLYYMNIREMYVSGDTLLAILSVSEYDGSGDSYSRYYGFNSKEGTLAVCYDLKNRANPVEKWRIYQDGGYISSRLIGDEFVLISDYYVNLQNDDAVVREECIPCTGAKGFTDRVPVDSICIMENISDSRYLVASVMDIDDESTYKTQAVLGAGTNVYCTAETLYVTNSRYDDVDLGENVFGSAYTQNTDVYKFDIRNCNIEYKAKGTVNGFALNQFSIDEFGGTLRIATTTGGWGDDLTNQLYVLDAESLEIIGSLEGIAKGETIKSVRFTGNTAYVVTFEQTDPLFVIDLTDKTAPVIKGELKIPGFSAYLHPVGEGLLLGIGVDGDENGTNGGIKVSLFDATDPEQPAEVAKLALAGVYGDGFSRYVETAALYDHKAVCWDDVNRIMYLPFVAYYDSWTNEYSYTNTRTAGVLAIKVDTAAKALENAGEYKIALVDDERWDNLDRTTYIGSTVFGVISGTGTVYSFDKTTAELLDTYTAQD